jgi:HAE1 family hydrophobic/amphiphilic exporter-1
MEMGKSRIRASYDGTAEIGGTVTSITLVIVVVFLPIALSSGLVSNIITQFCMTVVISLLSLLASFTIIPWLSSRFGKLEHIEETIFWKNHSWFRKYVNSFTNWVTEILNWFEPLHQNYFSCHYFFSSTIGLVGGGFMVVSFLRHQIVVSF